MASGSKHKKGMFLLGLLLVAAGLVFVLIPAGAGVAEFLMRLWPVFLICAGVVRVMGFAVERKPRSPMGGMLLIVIGVLFFASRFHSNLNALEIYGRYWLLLLAIYASVELVRYYSHRHAEGPPPRIFTAWRLILILFIVGTGVLANRLATNPSVLSALRLPGFLSGLRDSVVGETYAFTDQTFVASEAKPGVKIGVSNSYGSVKVTGGGSSIRATLTKGVRAWNEDDARKIASQIRLVINQTPDGYNITTNRDQFNQQFTTDIQIEVPASAAVSIVDSYGAVTASGTSGELSIKASYGRVEVSGINGNVRAGLAYCDIDAANIVGDLIITGAKNARISSVTGSAQVGASNGSVDIRDVSGELGVSAPFCRINAQGLGAEAEIKTEHGSVRIARAADVFIEAPHSDVRAENIGGDLHLESSHSDIQLRSISGEVVVGAEQSAVTAEEIRGSIEVDTSHRDVVIKNFYESVTVLTSYKNVTLVSAGQPVGDIKVENNHGEIKLLLPPSSQFRLDASSANGQVKYVGFSDNSQTRRDSLYAVLGEDGPKIKLRTSYKSITVQANGARQTPSSALVKKSPQS